MKLESKVRFVCGLSNGEFLVEGKGVLERIPNELSPYHKLQKYIKDNNLTITSFYLAIGDRHFQLPSVKPRFNGIAPFRYNCFRRFEGDEFGTGAGYEFYTVAEAYYPDFKIQLWVDEKEGEKSWINIVPRPRHKRKINWK